MTMKHKQEISPAYVETVEEITRVYKSLPPRPSIEEAEAAISVVETAENEEKQRVEEISKQVAPQDVPPELFSLLTQARKAMVVFESYEQKKEAMHLIELDKTYKSLDGLILKASELVSGGTLKEELSEDEPSGDFVEEVVISDESVIKKEEEADELKNDGGLKGLVKSSSAKASVSFSGDGDAEKLSLMKVAAMIENSAKIEAEVLDLRGKLLDKIEWLPVSLGKLSNVIELNMSENRIMALPTSIGNLKALRKLDIRSNQIINLPESFGELINLTDLDLHANNLKSLPASFGNLINLINLDLSLNRFTQLPDVIGSLTSLKVLNAETNELEGVTYTIGSCLSLVELRLDFNQLKALPEALGKLECLEILTLHYNRIRRLPTTMANLLHLRELDASFNELESIPESLVFAVGLKKLNVGKNFADLRALPNSIGNLEMLEELDISDDQIPMLPESFRLLSNLKVFRADETPLEVPPRQIVKLGAQAVVQYMEEYVANKEIKSLIPKKKRGLFSRICPLHWCMTA